MSSKRRRTTLVVVALTMQWATALRASSAELSQAGFHDLMRCLADAWTRQDTGQGLACFTEDAVYMQPPDQQLYRGHGELRKLFAALKAGTLMTFHHLAFDELAQVGFGEFTFGSSGSGKADHGIVVAELRQGRIAFWREYFREGPPAYADFIKQDGKSWKWTAERLDRME